MPWSAPSVIELRIAFVHAVRTAKRPLAVACRDFRISRKTGYKWLARFALVCGTDVTMARAGNVLGNVFGEYGLPDAILCDNAFGSWGPGVSWFEARLMRLDVRVVHGRPYHPQTQGKVERFHGTLEAEIFPRLPRDNLEHFQAGLEQWRRDVYNAIRPHEALGDVAPVTRWRPCERRRPAKLPTVEYPDGTVIRKVSTVGDVRWRCAKILAGHGLIGEFVRIEEIDNLVNLWYGTHRIRQIPVDQLRTAGLL